MSEALLRQNQHAFSHFRRAHFFVEIFYGGLMIIRQRSWPNDLRAQNHNDHKQHRKVHTIDGILMIYNINKYDIEKTPIY